MVPEILLKLSPYFKQKQAWPKMGQVILAQYSQQYVVVYQAFNPQIATAIVKNQCYHHEDVLASGLSLKRMSWIKTNFLWMMFRAGWATKKNQERILAVKVKKQGFQYILRHAFYTLCKEKNQKKQQLQKKEENNEQNQENKKHDEAQCLKVRLQWDPDHEPNGQKVKSGRRAIQLGLGPQIFVKFSKQLILSIEDVTDLAKQGKNKLDHLQELITPFEEIYEIQDEEVRKAIMNA